jgi:hypothetical protein
MTRYDPFSYGQLPIGGRGPAPSTPDDILFDPAASPAPASTPAMARGKAPANPWEAAGAEGFNDLLAQGGGEPSSAAEASAMSFGAEVLGEVAAEAHAPRERIPATRQKAAARAAAAGSADTAGQEAPKQKQPLPRRELPPLELPTRRRPLVLALLGTLAVGGGGLAASGWLLVVQHNPILAAIAGAASVVGGAIAWLLLRP